MDETPARVRRESEVVEILVVGDLTSARKGVDVVIDALLRAPELNCQLTVVGGGNLLPKLVQRAEGDPRVRFTGTLPPSRIRDLYRGADVVLFPTRSDVFGLVLVEAMGAGAAVAVSPAAGAVADLAVHEYNCLVVPGYEAAAWANATSRLVRDSNLRSALGFAAARTIRNRWTIDHAADAMLAGLRLGVLVGRHLSNKP
jgi:glycosyltransferase involved in cell wall biosynthesis